MSTPVANQFNEVADVYDDLMSVVPYRWWVHYVRGLWTQYDMEPQRVLELACGTGNVLRELLKHGYQVAGVDFSAPMLRCARKKLPRHVPLWHQDARALELPGSPFDSCLCLFDSLNYLLEVADLQRAFRGVRRHLAPGGSFIFDMNSIRALEKGMFEQTGTGSDPSLEYEWHSAWERTTRLCTVQMEFRATSEGGTRIFHETHVQRGYTVEEIHTSLTVSGFDVLAIYEAFTTRPPTAKTDRYYVVARAAA